MYNYIYIKEYSKLVESLWYKALIILRLEYKRIISQGVAYIISFALAWFLTNGWAYTLLAIGTAIHVKWMTYIGSAYLAILWLPCTPEKVITIPLAVGIKKLLFSKKI